MQDDFRPCEWVNAANGDLTIRLWKAMCSFPGVRSIKFQKIGSHAERKENSGRIHLFSIIGVIAQWIMQPVKRSNLTILKFCAEEIMQGDW